jgi:hypothetical protein
MACKYLWVLVSGYILPVLFCIQVRLVASLTQVLLSLMVLLLVNLLQFAEPDKLLVQREIAAAVMRLRDQDPHQGCSCGVQEPSTMDSRVTPTGARDKDLDSRDRADAINPRAEGDERRKVMKTWWRRIVGGKRGKMEL